LTDDATPTPVQAIEPRLDDPHLRLLRAIGTVVAEKGYAATTIADIVRAAQASKTTFYQHYTGKLSLFLASYRRGSERLVRRMIAGGRDAEGPWSDRVRAAISAYLAVLADAPATTRTFTMEIQAAGPEAVALRREMHRRTAEGLIALVDDVRRGEPSLRALDPVLADGIVGAMTELILIAVAEGRTPELLTLVDPISSLIFAVLTAPDPPAPAR
jgi:AcrR family transcriptional regulator